jgi:L-threonylcarbamoyladenylate synthase
VTPSASVQHAAGLIRAGRLVAFPTETVYGLGANALDARAVARVFAAKERPAFDPLIVHLADASAIGACAEPADADDPRVARLAARFWPGPLTLVLRKRAIIPGIVTAGLPTVGLRVPDHPVARALIRAAGVPVAAPSANRFGGLSPTRAAHVVAGLGSRVDLVLDGGRCRVGVESTVVLLAAGRAVLLRPGGLAVEAIEAEIGPLEVPDDAAPGTAELAPGRAGAHYAPRAPLKLADPRDPAAASLFAAHPGERVGLLAASDAGRAVAEAIGGPFRRRPRRHGGPPLRRPPCARRRRPLADRGRAGGRIGPGPRRDGPPPAGSSRPARGRRRRLAWGRRLGRRRWRCSRRRARRHDADHQ